MQIVAMTAGFASEIVTWSYPPPHDVYSLTRTDPKSFLDEANGYFALVDEQGGLIGYRCFGPDGRVPGWPYDDSALDTGGGLRPDLTGRGRGRAAITVGLDFGRRRYRPAAFRVTVAAFNERALRVVRSLDFTDVATFTAPNGRDYVVLTRAE
jgi:RimJ/RimL family protein N-acetyltransferase